MKLPPLARISIGLVVLTLSLLLTGDFVAAARAEQLGLVNKVVAADQLDAAAMALAERIVEKSATAVAYGKPAFYAQLDMSVREAYRYTAGVMVRNMLEDDAGEGIDAFLEKRSPDWGRSG